MKQFKKDELVAMIGRASEEKTIFFATARKHCVCINGHVTHINSETCHVCGAEIKNTVVVV